jgi:hypothetical protein
MEDLAPFKRVSVSVDITVATNNDAITYLLYQSLRQADLLKFDDPHDDHPNLAMTSSLLRSKLSAVVSQILTELPLELVSA